MGIEAIIFDIGGVLEYTPKLGLMAKWEQKLGLSADDINKRLGNVWRDGSYGTMSLEDVHTKIIETLAINEATLKAFMDDIWTEYVGTPNSELIDYFRALRPKYRTAILSNSFVGAREKEESLYHFSEMCELIIYSHEVGLMKPDPKIYALSCERLNLPAESIIFVDDVQENIDAACDFGIYGILFQDNQQVIADIEDCILKC